MDSSLIPMILTALVFSFFFAGIEIAFLSANKLQIELQGKQGVLWAEIMSKYLKNPSGFIGTTLIGNTLALVVFGIYTTQFFEPLLTRHLPAWFNNQVPLLIIQSITSPTIILFP